MFRTLRPALALPAVLGVSLLVAQSGAAPTLGAGPTRSTSYEQAHAVTNWSGKSWLCYGWRAGVYHCIARWHHEASSARVSTSLRGLKVAARPAAHPASATTRTTKTSRSGSSGSGGSGGSGGSSWQGSVPDLIRSVFGSYASGALAVARCESGFNPNAYNPSSGASGVYQFLASTWATTSYARYSRSNAWANVHAAHQVFVRDGYSWREWSCQP
ncbi:MAG TPA: transglycosylase SLT domain-containing protein [Ktedonobacterales bacterium]|nr:transglycosylase SLT domain-containing protein [Ktedonobacterales bacterium]